MTEIERKKNDLLERDAAFRCFHERRAQALMAYVAQRVAEHVSEGGNDTGAFRYDCALEGMRTLIDHTDLGVWRAAWQSCRTRLAPDARAALTQARDTLAWAQHFNSHADKESIPQTIDIIEKVLKACQNNLKSDAPSAKP